MAFVGDRDHYGENIERKHITVQLGSCRVGDQHSGAARDGGSGQEMQGLQGRGLASRFQAAVE